MAQAHPRPKDLPYTNLTTYGQALYGLRFMFQLWPLWLAILAGGPMLAWWKNFATLPPAPISDLFVWLTALVRPVAAMAVYYLAYRMKRVALASWNTVDAAMVALMIVLVTHTIQYGYAAGIGRGTPIVLTSPVTTQAMMLFLLTVSLIFAGIRFPFDNWMQDLTREDPQPEITGTVVAPPPPGLRDIDPEKLAADLSRRVIGQDVIAAQLSRAVARRLAQQRRGKPVFTGLFAGPTGVGKTEMAKALAEKLLGSEKLLYRVDCGNVLGEAGLQTLIGAPTGYMGSDKPGALTAHVLRFPNSILLFDEIEKAASANPMQGNSQQSPLFRLLLSLLDEGRFTEQSTGQAIDATGCVILMTSNAAHRALGQIYQQHHADPAALTRATKDELQATFSPEFLARIDLVTTFSPLDPQSRGKVIALHTARIGRQYEIAVRKIDASLINEALVQWQALENYGAREVLRWLEETIADPLIIAKKQGYTDVSLTMDNGQLIARPLQKAKKHN